MDTDRRRVIDAGEHSAASLAAGHGAVAGGYGILSHRTDHWSHRRLNICADGLAGEELLAKFAFPSPAAARSTAGEVVVRALCRPLGSRRYPDDQWHGLQVSAADGALFRTQGHAGTQSALRLGQYLEDHETPYPMLRLVALMNTRSHILANATISPYRKGRFRWWQVRCGNSNQSVTLLDKGSSSVPICCSASVRRTGSALAHRKRDWCTRILRFHGEGDRLL